MGKFIVGLLIASLVSACSFEYKVESALEDATELAAESGGMAALMTDGAVYFRLKVTDPTSPIYGAEISVAANTVDINAETGPILVTIMPNAASGRVITGETIGPAVAFDMKYIDGNPADLSNVDFKQNVRIGLPYDTKSLAKYDLQPFVKIGDASSGIRPSLEPNRWRRKNVDQIAIANVLSESELSLIEIARLPNEAPDQIDYEALYGMKPVTMAETRTIIAGWTTTMDVYAATFWQQRYCEIESTASLAYYGFRSPSLGRTSHSDRVQFEWNDDGLLVSLKEYEGTTDIVELDWTIERNESGLPTVVRWFYAGNEFDNKQLVSEIELTYYVDGSLRTSTSFEEFTKHNFNSDYSESTEELYLRRVRCEFRPGMFWSIDDVIYCAFSENMHLYDEKNVTQNKEVTNLSVIVNADGQVVERRSSEEGVLYEVTKIEYTAEGTVAVERTDRGSTSYQSDGTVRTPPDGETDSNTFYSYWVSGRLRSVSQDRDGDDQPESYTRYDYDAQGRLTTEESGTLILDRSGKVESIVFYEYYANGMGKSETVRYLDFDDNVYAESVLEFDQFGQLVLYEESDEDAVAYSEEFTYDKFGNVLENRIFDLDENDTLALSVYSKTNFESNGFDVGASEEGTLDGPFNVMKYQYSPVGQPTKYSFDGSRSFYGELRPDGEPELEVVATYSANQDVRAIDSYEANEYSDREESVNWELVHSRLGRILAVTRTTEYDDIERRETLYAKYDCLK